MGRDGARPSEVCERRSVRAIRFCRQDRGRLFGVIFVAGDAFRGGPESWLSPRAVTFQATVLHRQQNIGALGAATRNLMAGLAVRSSDRDMFGVIEIGLEHPAIDQDWLCDLGSADRGWFNVMAVGAAGKVCRSRPRHSRARFVRISLKENARNQVLIRAVLPA